MMTTTTTATGTSIITTTTSKMATTTTMVTEAWDAYTSWASGTMCVYFFYFFEYFTNFFYRLTTNDNNNNGDNRIDSDDSNDRGLRHSSISSPGKFSFFFLISCLTNTYILTVATTTPQSPLLSPPLPLPQNSSQPCNNDERGPNNGTLVLSFVP